MHLATHDRRGISLLEVLISIGILSIGLMSVLALIPAGRAQAVKASVLDRTTALALNAAADFITRGFARPAGWVTPISATRFAVFDPLGNDPGGGMPLFWSGTVSAGVITPRTDSATTANDTVGITAVGGTATGLHMQNMLVRGEDDIRYSTDGLGEDDLPVPRWTVSGTTGRHASDGVYSYLATLSGTNNNWSAGEFKTLTIVAFARRDTSFYPVMLNPTADGSWTVDQSNVPAGSSLKDLMKPGGMILSVSGGTPQWHRVLMVSDMSDANTPSTWKVGLTCETSVPSSTVYIFPGAVGSAQLLIKLEGSSVWNDR